MNIVLWQMDVGHAAPPGTQVEVGKLDGRRSRIAAGVANLPFYDPDKTRVRW